MLAAIRFWVSRMGSVHVSELMVIERYSHVMHIVSNVRGRLSPGRDAYDVIRACFPAGTLTGAPKVRAMEIIAELEPTRRGVYTGSIGYFGFDGAMDTSIVIRTFVPFGPLSFRTTASTARSSIDCPSTRSMMSPARMPSRPCAHSRARAST